MQTHFLKARQSLQSHIHSFFQNRDYLSIDAPIAVLTPGTEVHLDYFATDWVDHQKESHRLFLRSSPELHLKQALSWGLPRVYHLGKCFRNGGEISAWHHPEFTMLEYYESGITLPAFMSLTEELVHGAADALKAFDPLKLPKSFQKISVFEAFERWAGIPLIDADPDLASKGLRKGFVSLQAGDDFETAYFKILLDVIEPELHRMEAVFLYDYPESQCALAKIKDGRSQRFELYMQGVELCNAFDELLDPVENRRRLEASAKQRQTLQKPLVPMDPDFSDALEQGLSACCGNALGFDRLLALLLRQRDLNPCVPFRANRPFRSHLPRSPGS